MNTPEKIVKNESLEDALTVLSLCFGYPVLDRLYSKHRKEAIQSGELLDEYQRLISEGVLLDRGCSRAEKGPHWKSPDFAVKKTYESVLK